MSAIPLEGYDPRFLPSCSKCGSLSVNFQWARHPFMWGAKELKSSCYTCGQIRYGEAQIRQDFDPQFLRWKRAQQEEERLLQEELLRRKAREEEEARLLQEEEARLLREKEREQELLNLLALQRAQEEQERVAREKEEEAKLQELRARRAKQKRDQRARKRARQEEIMRAQEKQREYARALVQRGKEVQEMVAAALLRQGEKKARIHPDDDKCAWKDCDNLPAENSKYCSRTCSNKNARWNHRQRATAISSE